MTNLINSSLTVRYDSTTESGFEPEKAIDGNAGSSFRANIEDVNDPLQIDLGSPQLVDTLYLSQQSTPDTVNYVNMRIMIYVSPVDVDNTDYSDADHLCYNSGYIEGVIQCSQSLFGQFIIIEPDIENGASGTLIFSEIYAWTEKSLAHTLTEVTPLTVGMTKNCGGCNYQ